MDSDAHEKFLKAGNIASQVRNEFAQKIKPGMLLLDIAEDIENKIRSLGGEVGFPVNLSLNEIAAHFTPTKGDETVVLDKSVLKMDIGVHVDGYVADTAVTLCFDEQYERLVESTKTALEEAIKLVSPGVSISDISLKIEETIKSFGYKPVSNLMGHGVSRWVLHGEPRIPNIKTESIDKLQEDSVIAIEPFATNGDGFVKDSGHPLIYMMIGKLPVRSLDSRKIIDFVEKYNGLPFAERWLPFESLFKIRMGMKEIMEKGMVHDYPALKETGNGMVSQHEHTIIVKDKPIVTTL